jgi:hypothetical protein
VASNCVQSEFSCQFRSINSYGKTARFRATNKSDNHIATNRLHGNIAK